MVQLYKQKVLECRHKNFMRSAIYTFCKRLKSKQFREIKIFVQHAVKRSLLMDFQEYFIQADGFSNQTLRSFVPSVQLKTICNYCENVSL